MNQTTLILIIMLSVAVGFLIVSIILPEQDVLFGIQTTGFYEDQVKLCDFNENCFIIAADDFMNKTQIDILEKSFKAVRNLDYLSEAELECYLNNALSKNLYCVEDLE